MVTHFNSKNLNCLLKKKPNLVYFCPPGAMGPSGLMLASYNENDFYVANYNRSKEKGYDNLIIKILENIPEFQLLSQNHKYDAKRERFDGLDYMYLGCGNVMLIQPEIYAKHEINNFFSFKNYLVRLNHVNLYKISTEDKTWKCIKSV